MRVSIGKRLVITPKNYPWVPHNLLMSLVVNYKFLTNDPLDDLLNTF
jgi:hypothetical protein